MFIRPKRVRRPVGRLGGMVLYLVLVAACNRSPSSEGESTSGQKGHQEEHREQAPPAVLEAPASTEYVVAETTLQAMVKAGGEIVPPSSSAAAAPAPASKPTAEFDAAFAKVLEPYHAIRKALAADSTAGVADAAKRLRGGLEMVRNGPLPGGGEAENEGVRKALTELEGAAAKLEAAPALEPARDAFATLTTPMMYLVAFHFHAPDAQQPFVYYCPMKKLAWLQDVKAMGNPYYGSMMLTCGMTVPREGAPATATP